MRSFRTQGIIIKRRNFNEADRIVTAYTAEFGKIQIKANGVRKITSRRSSHIELLNLSQLGLYQGKQMFILTEVQTDNTFEGIKSDLKKTGFAYHICELVDGLCPEAQEQPQIFSLLYETLKELETAAEDQLLIIVHNFEVALLTMLGYWHKDPESSQKLDTGAFIEQILERRLKSRKIFSRLQ